MFKQEIFIIKALRPLFGLHPWQLFLIVVLGILEAIAEGLSISMFIPFLYNLQENVFETEGDSGLQQYLNGLFTSIPPADRLLVIAVSIFSLILIRNSLSYGKSLLSGYVDARIGHYLRCRVLDELLTVAIQYIDKNESGKLWNILENETYTTCVALSTAVNLVTALITLPLFTALLLALSWEFTLVVGFALALVSLIVKLATRRVEEVGKAGVIADEALSHRIFEIFNGMHIIRIFGRESFEKQRFIDISRNVSDIYFKIEKMTNIVKPMSELMVGGLLIFVMLTLLRDVSNLPTVLVFIFILYRLHPQALALDEARTELLSASASIAAVMDVLKNDNKPYILPGHLPFQHLQRALVFDDVSFSYSEKNGLVLDHVSLAFHKGKFTAIVGRSGSGKSTLINLVLRLYDPGSGTILVDDTPIAQFDLKAWRDRIAVVSQQTYIFSGTVRENIAYGRLNATDEAIMACAKQAAAHEFILGLPHGYDTLIGDSGVLLSGGQQQRIALARALIREPEILILDEATNALDSISEKSIFATIRRLKGQCTIIIIAHQLTTVEEADHIVVLESGRVKEQGRAEELIKNKAVFAEMYHLQSRRVALQGVSE